jgi:hypothetical protein
VTLSQHAQLLGTSFTPELLDQAKKSLLRRTAKEALSSSRKSPQLLLRQARVAAAAAVEVEALELALEEE